jgi:hypothetical protein
VPASGSRTSERRDRPSDDDPTGHQIKGDVTGRDNPPYPR